MNSVEPWKAWERRASASFPRISTKAQSSRLQVPQATPVMRNDTAFLRLMKQTPTLISGFDEEGFNYSGVNSPKGGVPSHTGGYGPVIDAECHWYEFLLCPFEECTAALWRKISSGWGPDKEWDEHTTKCVIYVSVFGLLIALAIGGLMYLAGAPGLEFLEDLTDVMAWVVDKFEFVFEHAIGLLTLLIRKGFELTEVFSESTDTNILFPVSTFVLAVLWAFEETLSEFLGNIRTWEGSIFAKVFRFFDFPFKEIENLAGSIFGDIGYVLAWVLLIPFNVAALILGLFVGAVIYPFQMLFSNKTKH